MKFSSTVSTIIPQGISAIDVAKLYIVNDLSNTIDLIPILSKAEALFRRFKKKVETIDKKYNFPSAPVRQRNVRSDSRSQSPTSPRRAVNRGPTSPRASGSSASASGVQNGRTFQTQPHTTQESDLDKERIITPELRQLLNRKAYWLTPVETREQSNAVQPAAK